MLYQVVLVFHVLIAVSLIALVLLQHGKGADAGAAFGSGASATVFGSQGSASFLTRATGALATGFFLTSLSLAYLIRQADVPTSVVDTAPAAAQMLPGGPAVPVDQAALMPLPEAAPAPVPVAPSDVPLPAE